MSQNQAAGKWQKYKNVNLRRAIVACAFCVVFGFYLTYDNFHRANQFMGYLSLFTALGAAASMLIMLFMFILHAFNNFLVLNFFSKCFN